MLDTVEELKDNLESVLKSLNGEKPSDKLIEETKFLIRCCEINDNILFC